MSQHELDEAVAKIRSEQVDDEIVKAAAKRVFGGLFDSAFIHSEPSGGKIRGCQDVQQLIPAYLSRSLSSARALLVEDHAFHCVDCRRVLQQARSGTASFSAIPIDRANRKRVPMLVWAVAATLIAGIGLGITGLLPGQNTVRATVASVQGTLYKVTDLGVSLVQVGQIVTNSDQLRTAKGSRAILRLAGGTQLEMAERSEISLSGGWRGPAVNLQRGQMIVEARKALYVTSGEMTIPVNGGVVAVDHGAKESRIAVAQGLVDVQIAQTTRRVKAGQQYGGELHLASLPISSEFAWSQNADSYLALLKEFSSLQKDLQAIPSPGLRYASRLPQYLPADTFVYAAIPNLGGTITEAKKLFDSRLAESEVLRQWWQQQAVSKNGEFDRIVDQVSALSNYLGDEIVIAVGGDVAGQNAGPVVLAEIKQAGLAEYLRSNLPANAQVQIVTAGAPASGGASKLLIQLDNSVMVVSPSATQLNRVEDILQKRAAGDFTSTPFFARIGQVYDGGAGYFLAANLEQIGAKSVGTAKGAMPSGFDNVQYLVLERKQASGDSEMRAALSFAGARHGIASWLAPPSPAGSLDFVSPDAGFAASMVMKNPRVMMQELFGIVGNANPNFTKEMEDFQAKAGLSLLDDVASPLGSDVTFALDGALVPIPAWKIAMEVYDPSRLQQTLALFVDRFNQQASPQAGRLKLSNEQINGRTFYSLSNEKAPGLAAYYTFVDGYLLASSSEANVQTAIDNKHTGHTLTSSPSFREKLPADGYPNFSAMVYTNMGSSLGDLAKQLKSSGQGQSSFGSFLLKGGSGLICVYGESDRIVAAARGSFLGFDLGTLVGIQQGKPLNSLIAGAKGTVSSVPTGQQPNRPTRLPGGQSRLSPLRYGIPN
jgi:hypothetical protein